MTDLRPAASTLQLAAGFDRALIRRGGDSVRFLVVDVTAPTVEAEKTPAVSKAPLNLALVIDASGSMQGTPIAAAKEAARRVAASLGAADRLSVVSFDSDITVHLEGRPQDAVGQAAAAAAIAALEAGSSTDLGGGWLRGCACVARVMEEHPGLRNRVVVLSDGQANRGIVEPDELATHASQLRARGLLSSAVGIGESYSDAQLEAIAASGGGRLHHAAAAAEIVELVLGELEELRETVVESCDLVLETPPGFAAELVGDYAATHDAGRWSCVVGSLASGALRRVVWKIHCPAGKLGESAELSIGASWRRVGAADAVAAAPVRCELRFATGEQCLAQPRDRERALIVAGTWQFSIVRAATRLNQDGELRRAGELVKRELRHFVRYAEGLPEAKGMVAALERLAASIGAARYAPMAAKEMRVASTKGLRGERELRAHAQLAWDTHLPK